MAVAEKLNKQTPAQICIINYQKSRSVSIAIEKGNAQCVTGCVKDRSSGFEGLFNFHVQEADEL